MWSGAAWLLLACTSCAPSKSTDMRCTLRVSANGVLVDGNATTRDEAVAACKRMSGATVIVESTAPAEASSTLRARLEHEHIKIYIRGDIGDYGCSENPLAKGCQ
jgi:hypothetical protein